MIRTGDTVRNISPIEPKDEGKYYIVRRISGMRATLEWVGHPKAKLVEKTLIRLEKVVPV